MGAIAKKQDNQPFFGISIKRGELLKSLSHLQSIVEKRNTLPILSNIKLEAREGGEFAMTVTDMDVVATEIIPVDVAQAGALTVPAAMLYDIVRKLPADADINLTSEESSGQLAVQAGASHFTLPYLPASDFPQISQGDMPTNFKMQTDEFLRLLARARFAVSNEETRYYLNGVYLHIAGDGDERKLKSVATDGHRLALVETALPEGANNMTGAIIPRKTVGELCKILEEQGEEVEVSLSEAKILISCGNITFLSKLVDGNYPDYTRVIPENNDKLLELDTDYFTEAVDRVATMATTKTRGVKFSLTLGALTLSARGTDGGFAEEKFDVSYSADEFETGFNSRYMLEMMSQLEGDTTQFLFSDPGAPAIVRDPSDVQSLYVIMPMRV